MSAPDLELEPLDSADPDLDDKMRALQRVLTGAPIYAARVTGLPPGAADAQSMFTALPEGKSYEDKYVYGIYLEDEMVGCADLIRRYPDPQTAHLGLLLLAEPYQRRGLGRVAFERLEAEVRRWPECRRLRLGVVATNAEVLPFWKRLGFSPTGEVKPYRCAGVVSEVVILTKPVPADA